MYDVHCSDGPIPHFSSLCVVLDCYTMLRAQVVNVQRLILDQVISNYAIARLKVPARYLPLRKERDRRNNLAHLSRPIQPN